MADNIDILDATSTTKTVAADEIASKLHQRVKITVGADGVNDGDISSANPMPVSGTVTISGVATAANQTTIIGHVDGIEPLLTTIDADTGNIATSVSGLLTDTQLRATPVPVSGTVAVTGVATEVTLAAVKTAVELIDNAISGSEMQVDIVAALPAGTNAIGKLAANSGVDIGDVDVTSLPALATGSNLVGRVNVDAQTGNGYSMFRDPALSNTAVAVKASAGNLAGCHIYNPNSSVSFIQLYDVAQGSVTVGTTTPSQTLMVPAMGGVDGDILPLSFATAITIAATTTITGSTAPSTALLVNLRYK